MKPVSDSVIDRFEHGALKALDILEAHMAYQGENPAYYHRAKSAAVVVGSYVRLRATETNRIATERQIGGMIIDHRLPQITDGKPKRANGRDS